MISGEIRELRTLEEVVREVSSKYILLPKSSQLQAEAKPLGNLISMQTNEVKGKRGMLVN